MVEICETICTVSWKETFWWKDMFLWQPLKGINRRYSINPQQSTDDILVNSVITIEVAWRMKIIIIIKVRSVLTKLTFWRCTQAKTNKSNFKDKKNRPHDHVLQELRRNFSSFGHDFVRRDANLAAHLLAKNESPTVSCAVMLILLGVMCNQVLDLIFVFGAVLHDWIPAN